MADNFWWEAVEAVERGRGVHQQSMPLKQPDCTFNFLT